MIDARLKIFFQVAAEYCSIQERTIFQVKNKLSAMKASDEDIDLIVDELISDDFINENRFVREFANGKFKNNKWGKIKIAYELKRHGINGSIIDSGLDEIDTDEYYDTLKKLITKKQNEIKEKNKYIAQKKVATSAIRFSLVSMSKKPPQSFQPFSCIFYLFRCNHLSFIS